MLDAQLLGLSWRMQRVGEEHEAGGQSRLVGREEARLPAAIGMSGQQHLALYEVPQHRRRRFQPSAVGRRIRGRRRSPLPLLPEREIAAQHDEARRAEGAGEPDQERRVAVRARAVRQHDSAPDALLGPVQEAADAAGFEESVFWIGHRHVRFQASVW